MTDNVFVAVAQLNSGNDINKNFHTCRELVERAAARRAAMIFFPENFAFVGTSPQASIAMSQPLTGELMQRYCSLAAKHNIWLSLGGFQERQQSEDTEKANRKVSNAHVIVDNRGHIVAHYRKIHLFDVNIPGGPSLCESAYTDAGSDLVTVDSPIGKLGLSVCYDVRFAEMYNALRRLDAQVLLVPAAFTVPTGLAHWTTLLRARAIETQCYVVAAAQTGKHNPDITGTRETYGHACIIDPWGTVIAECGEGVGLAFAEISLSKVERVRRAMPVMQHRRPAIYQCKL